MTRVRGSQLRPLLVCATLIEAALLLIHCARSDAEQVARTAPVPVLLLRLPAATDGSAASIANA